MLSFIEKRGIRDEMKKAQFVALYNFHFDALERSARRWVGNLFSEDVVQDVFEILLLRGGWEHLQANRSSYQYLWTSCYHVIQRNYREGSQETGQDILSVMQGAPNENHEIFDGLDEESKSIVVLYYIHGYNASEISDKVGKHRTTISRTINNFVDSVRDYLPTVNEGEEGYNDDGDFYNEVDDYE